MKLNPQTIEILMPVPLSMKATNQLKITNTYLSISSSLVKKMHYPEYARFYIDRENQLFFIVPCQATTKGARRFYRPKAGNKTVVLYSKHLLQQLAEVGHMKLSDREYRFHAQEVEERETALGFDLSMPVAEDKY